VFHQPFLLSAKFRMFFALNINFRVLPTSANTIEKQLFFRL